MLSAIFSALLLFTNPIITWEHPMGSIPKQEQVTVIQLCQADILEFSKGNKDFLAKATRTLKPDQQSAIKLACQTYAQGLVDGAALSSIFLKKEGK
jgi:hypothetical protein